MKRNTERDSRRGKPTYLYRSKRWTELVSKLEKIEERDVERKGKNLLHINAQHSRLDLHDS
jgi:hypothetical protein